MSGRMLGLVGSDAAKKLLHFITECASSTTASRAQSLMATHRGGHIWLSLIYQSLMGTIRQTH